MAIVMVLAGIVGYVLLPVAQFPDIAPPQVVVASVYAGDSARIVADTVTTPLEQQINGVEGMAYMSSVSGYNVDIAAVDVQKRGNHVIVGQLQKIKEGEQVTAEQGCAAGSGRFIAGPLR